jgi:addiction module HigA family antidote
MPKLTPIHPGEVLAEDFMGPRGLSASQIALDLRVPANRITDIVRGKRGITADTALRLARYFDTSPEMWLHLQIDYDLRMAQEATGAQIARDVVVR